MSTIIKIKRGLQANLPATASDGELLATTDTKLFYLGQGEGQALIEMKGVQGFQGAQGTQGVQGPQGFQGDVNTQFQVDINRYGFLNQTDTTLAFDENTYTFTLGDAGSGWSYYRAGIRTNLTGDKTVVLVGAPPATATYFIYIDSNDGTLIASTVAWTLLDTKVLVATINWNPLNTPKFLIGEERHSVLIDRRMHYRDHTTKGTQYLNGGALTGYTLNSDVDTSKVFAVAQAQIMDEDIINTIAALTKPDGIALDFFSFYRTAATSWTWGLLTMPFHFVPGSFIQYDNAGVLTAGQTGKFYNSYVLYSNKKGIAAITIIQGRGEFASLTAAQAEDPLAFSWTGFPIAESIIAYQLTWDAKNVYNSSGKVRLAAEPKAIKAATITAASGQAGPIGPQGYQGFQGEIGAQGSQGFQGDVGVQGTQGPQGATGAQGVAGLGFSIAKIYSSVALLDLDISPTGILPGEFAIINTGDVENPEESRLYLWNGLSYQYQMDLSGASGIQGPAGSQGYQGETGAQGTQGSQGYQGETGAQGTQGFQGEIGAQGVQGFQGYQGDIGLQGTQGYQGEVGAQGAQGAVGTQGEIGTQGPTGASLKRYEIGGIGSKCYAHATGAVGDITLSIVANAATISATNGAHLISAAIHFSATDMAGVTSASVDFGSNIAEADSFPGSGDNSSYATMFPPQFQCWADVAGNRAFRTTVTAHLNANSHTMTFTNLIAGQAIWINLTF